MLNWSAKIILLGGLIAVLATTACAQKMEHNSFLTKPVFTTQGLVDQVKNNKVVRKRYETHFKVTGPTIERYFKKLRLRPLTNTAKRLVYNVDKKYVVKSRKITFRKGTLVFVDPKGRIVLKRSCGNPMTAIIPRETQAMFKPSPVEVAAALNEPSIEEDPPAGMVEAEEPPPSVPQPLAPPTPEPIAAEPTLTETFVVPPIIPPIPYWPLAPFAILPFLPSGDNGRPPVPEPASVLVISAGAAALLRKRKKRS